MEFNFIDIFLSPTVFFCLCYMSSVGSVSGYLMLLVVFRFNQLQVASVSPGQHS